MMACSTHWTRCPDRASLQMGCSARVSQNSHASSATFSSASCVRCSMYCRETQMRFKPPTTRFHFKMSHVASDVSPVWCCACAVSDGRFGPPTAWPELCTRSSSPRSLHHPPTQRETENTPHRTDELSLQHRNNYIVHCEPNWTCVYLYERVDVVHESLSPADNELIHTRYGMRPIGRMWISRCYSL